MGALAFTWIIRTAVGLFVAYWAFFAGRVLGALKGRQGYLWGALCATAIASWMGLTLGSRGSSGGGWSYVDSDDGSDYDDGEGEQALSVWHRVAFGSACLAVTALPVLYGTRRGIAERRKQSTLK